MRHKQTKEEIKKLRENLKLFHSKKVVWRKEDVELALRFANDRGGMYVGNYNKIKAQYEAHNNN